jgi:hypothetical protein
MEIPMIGLFTTYTLTSTSTEITPENINDYMIGLWFQQNTDMSLTAYMPIPCVDVQELSEV